MSRTSGALRRLPLLLLVVAFASQGSAVPPLDEIRGILGQELVPEPTVAALVELSGENFQEALAALDPYAVWFPPDEASRPFRLTRTLGGIGAELEVSEGRAWLLPRQGAPLAAVGFLDRAELVSVDGQPVAGLDAGTVAALLQGEPGTGIRLLLTRQDGRQRYDVRLVRETTRPLDVELWHMEEAAVLRITDFVAGRTRTALAATLEQLASGTGRVVIDLRYAGGGDLYEAIDAAAMLVGPDRLLCSLHGRERSPQILRSTSDFRFEREWVLLVGPSTASAAEIFAGILRHHQRALLVGQQTFGKCHSQTERRLGDGSTLRFTNREVRFPDGSSCSNNGLVPDVRLGNETLRDLEQVLRALPRRRDATDPSAPSATHGG